MDQLPTKAELERLWPYLTQPEQDRLLKLLGPRLTKYVPHVPTERQTRFLALDCREAFYGGAAGGGKSDALLMAALQYVDVPSYAAILFRRTYADLALEGALMDRADEWLRGTDAHWNGKDKRWTFPSGSSLTFGYMDTESDKFRYKSAEFQFVGFDELTQFSETQYRFMFSRIRRRVQTEVPLRMRGASNPGDVGHDWVKERFILYPKERVFVPAALADNPYLDYEEYVQNLNELDPITRAQMLAGDWDAAEGGMFKREWFRQFVDIVPKECKRVRYWDKAGTKDGGAYSVGLLMALDKEGTFYVEDVVRGQWGALERNRIIEQTAEMDAGKYGKPKVDVWVEQEPGSGGKESAEYTIRQLAGYPVHSERVTGEKEDRARPYASQVEAGNVVLRRGEWNKPYVDELTLFPMGQYKDQTDASSGAFNKLALTRKLELKAWVV
jgi:predicted phage terminase large subunit-like protein